MLSPNNTKPKATAHSIWSFDSGYGSKNASSSSLGLQLHPQGQVGAGFEASWSTPVQNNDRLENADTAIEPLFTKLNVFATTETSDNDFNLPEISTSGDTCLECEFWEITNPGENFKCHKCQLPETIEPHSLFLDEKSPMGLLPRLHIPIQCPTKRVHPVNLQEIGSSSRPRKSSYPSAAFNSRAISRCSACELSALVDPSNSKFCSSCSFRPGFLSPISEMSPNYEVKRSRAGRGSKLRPEALNRLQAWLKENQHDPYPDSETKRLLAQECGITEKQVTTWFTNARARKLNPLDTSNSSNSDEEAASDTDIATAVEASTHNTGGFNYISNDVQQDLHNQQASTSDAAPFSNTQPRARISRRGKKKIYRRNAYQESPQTPLLLSPTSMTSPIDAQNAQESWNCTFCHKALVPKSWRRHEETQHRPKAEWTCMLYGPRLTISGGPNSNSVCAFCMMNDPSEDHFLSHHRIEDCAKRDIVDRTFYRPDHLRQHIKNFHNAGLSEYVQARWKRAADAGSEGWTCGFCAEKLDTWDKRETHIANHFKEGMTIASWTDYSGQDVAAAKHSKKKEKEKETPHTRSYFSRLTRRSSQQTQATLPQSQAQLQSSPFTGFDSLPTSHGFGLSQPQAPILPDIPTLGPINLDDFSLDWTTISASPIQQMPYQLPNTNAFVQSLEANQLHQQFDNSLNMDLYGNQIDYHGPWGHDQQQ